MVSLQENKKMQVKNNADYNIVMKQRSTAACIREGFSFIGRHLRALLKSTWTLLLLTAVTMAAYLMVMIQVRAVPEGYEVATRALVILYVAYVAYTLSTALLTGRLMTVLKAFRDTGIVPRLKIAQGWKDTIRMALRSLLFSVWIALLAAPGNQLIGLVAKLLPTPESTVTRWALIIGGIVLMVIAVISLLPLFFTYYKYVMDGGSFLRMLGPTYKKGSHHKAKILVTGILTAILLAVTTSLLLVPMLILVMASTLSAVGVMLGDPSGLPSYFTVLIATTFVVTLFVTLYINMAMGSTGLYLYGSIETQENERNQYLNKTVIE